jgi:flagellar hook-associated protein 3 FlgL
MRVPYDVVRDGLSAINLAAQRMADAQRQVSTGRRIARAGDDAAATQQAVSEHATLATTDAYSRTGGTAAARLTTADSLLSSFGDKLGAVIVAAMSAQGSSVTAAARSAAADAVTGLRDSLVADINTTSNGVSLFAGTESGAKAYALVGGSWVYQGNNDVAQVEVERGRLISTTFDGQAIAQGSDADNVFTVMDQLVAAINAGDDAAISAAVGGIERALDRTLRAQGSLGADERGLDEAAVRLSAVRYAAETRRASLEDANMAEAITNMADAETAYRASLAAVSTIERVSLLDYLR